MAVKRIFVDTNVITSATIRVAPFHDQALMKLDQLWDQGTDLYISHQVIREYMVNSTRGQTYGPALPMPQVLREVQRLRGSFYVLNEEPEILDNLLDLLRMSQWVANKFMTPTLWRPCS